MLKACEDCKHLRSISSSGNCGTIACSGHVDQNVSDVSKHLRTYYCENFEPKRPSSEICELLHEACSADLGSLSKALERWFSDPPNDVTVDAYRLPMLSVSDQNLKSFERDDTLKSYTDSNHMFADALGPAKIRVPFIIYMSPSNTPGVQITSLPNSRSSIVSLGRPYSLAEVTAAFSHVLARQGAVVVSPWFLRRLRDRGIDPTDPSFASFVALPPAFAKWLLRKKSALVGAHTVIAKKDHIDLEAIGDALLTNGKSGVISCDASNEFHFTSDGRQERDVAEPSQMSAFLQARGLQLVLLQMSQWDTRFWAKLPKNSFDNVETVLVLTEPETVDSVAELEAFGSFARLSGC